MKITPSLMTRGDPRLLRIVLDNLLANALKFNGSRARATIEVGTALEAWETVCFVKDDGRHGGRVWAHGEVGRGATFSFTLGVRKRKDEAS